jgi:hypothetical protein
MAVRDRGRPPGSKSPRADARLLKMAVTRKDRGRPPGSKSPRADARLLEIYDHVSADCTERVRSALPRLVAAHVKARWPDDYRAAVESIERRLRRLLKSREKGRAGTTPA